jgi:hypothetical protein
MMRPKTINDGPFPRPTDRAVNRKQAIHMAVPGAQVTIFQVPKGLVYPLRELSRSQEPEIARLEL